MTTSAGLPASIMSLLDGSELESKVGVTLLLVVSDDAGWPRIASLSVGELFAARPDELLLTMYERSRTTQALISRGRAVLHVVDDGAILKVNLGAEVLGSADGRTTFRCTVDAVERDEVPYARVIHGIEFELVRESGALTRWARQLDELKELA